MHNTKHIIVIDIAVQVLPSMIHKTITVLNMQHIQVDLMLRMVVAPEMILNDDYVNGLYAMVWYVSFVPNLSATLVYYISDLLPKQGQGMYRFSGELGTRLMI